jgi:hypothetical protein
VVIKSFDRKYEYRPDGWPLCPQCGDDELWSRVPGHSSELPETPALLLACFAEPFTCYFCNWSGRLPHREQGWQP